MRIKKSVLGLLDHEVARLEKEGRLSRRSKILATRNSMASFLKEQGVEDVKAKELDKELLNNYEKWLQGKGLKPNSSAFYLRMLQAVLNSAVREGLIRGKADINAAFSDVTTHPSEMMQASVIRPEAFIALRHLDIGACLAKAGKDVDDAATSRMKVKMETVRDLFVFSFAAQGMDFGDLCYLRKADVSGGQISYVRKSSGQPVTVPVRPVMQEIMDRYPSDGPYLFPLLTAGTDEEAYKQYKRWQKDDIRLLKVLGQWLPDQVTLLPSTARETWTAEAYRNLMPLEDIARALGLRDDTAVAVYLRKFDFGPSDDLKRQVVERFFGG